MDFTDDETSVKRKVGRPPGSKNNKKDCTKPASRVSNEKASRMIKSSAPTSIISTVPSSSLITPSTLNTSYQKISEVHQSKSSIHLPSSSKSCLVLSSNPEASSKVSPAVCNISSTNQKVSRIIKSSAATSIISTIPRCSLITPSTLDTSNQKISKVHQSKSVHLPSSPKSCLVLLSKPEASSKVSPAVSNMTTNQKVSKMIKSSAPISILLSTPRSSLITPSTLDISNQKISKVHQSESPVHSPSLPKSCLVLSSKPKVSSKVSSAVSALSPTYSVSSLPKTSLVSSQKPFPFTIKTLPYGNDNIFMRKPSPPDEEDTVSADETEKIIEPAAVSLPKPGTSELTSIGSTDLISQTVMNDEKQTSLLFKRSSTAPSCLKATLGTTTKPVLSSSKTVPVYLTSSTFKMAGPSEKSKSISSLIRFRKASDVNLSPFTLNKSKSSRFVPLSSKSILVPSKMLKTSPKKVIHILPKNPISLKTSHELSNVTGSKNNYPTSSNQAVKIVTYANVDDPNEPSKDYCLINRNSATATLVKMNAPCDVQNKKEINVLKVPSTGTKIGTCEETVEKQLTGKVLHESVNLETTTSVPTKNLGYTICYEKSGGSVISQELPPTASAPNLRQPILPFTHIKDIQPTMPNEPQ